MKSKASVVEAPHTSILPPLAVACDFYYRQIVSFSDLPPLAVACDFCYRQIVSFSDLRGCLGLQRRPGPFCPSFSAIFNRKMQKLPLFSCILIRNEGKNGQGGRYEQADNGVVYDCPGSDPVTGAPDGPGCDAIFNKWGAFLLLPPSFLLLTLFLAFSEDCLLELGPRVCSPRIISGRLVILT